MRKFTLALTCLLFLSTLLVGSAHAESSRQPVTPEASPEACALLAYLYSISGTNTLSGQHNQPIYLEVMSNRAAAFGGAWPAVYGQDFGFSPRDTLDSIHLRQDIVHACIRQHQQGSIVTLMWHAVAPMDDEPAGWRESVQRKLTDEEWNELITPGTPLHERWKAQVDVVAWYLRQLQQARVPVIWRPYHEMNGSWFWWGGRSGPDGYVKLYRMLYDRLVHFHKLNNLLWCFNGNEVREGILPYAEFYPGHDTVDILATDVYLSGYDAADYNALIGLGEGRPIALGEVGTLPTPAQLATQPAWTWFMTWSDLLFSRNKREDVRILFQSEQVLNRGDYSITPAP